MPHLTARLRTGAVEIPERPLGLRERDAVPAGQKIGNEGGGAVDPDAAALVPATVPANGQMNRTRMGFEHAPERGRTLVSDRRALAEREHGRHAAPFE